jgi:hypothetical protein
VKLTTHFHLVPRAKNEWSYTSTPPVRRHGITLPFTFTYYLITRAICKVCGLAAVRRCYAGRGGDVMSSCSSGGNVVVASSSSLQPSAEFELPLFKRTLFRMAVQLRKPFEKFVDSPYSKKRPSPHLHNVPTRSNKVGLTAPPRETTKFSKRPSQLLRHPKKGSNSNSSDD